MPEALIWGASGGIGGALVRALKARGWKVYGAARNESRIPSDADLTCSFSAGNDYSIDGAVSLIAYQTSALDLIVYAAGGIRLSAVEDTDSAAWSDMLIANLTGAARTIRASLPLLKEGGHAMIVGAYVDKVTLPRFAPYAVAKAGLEPLVAILAKEQRKRKFTLVRPPAVATPFWDGLPLKVPANALTPEQVADAMIARYDSGETGMLDL
ncbi:MAG: SDR family NAD(P)-dependent oxidoreductase [Chloroflexota bacterium]|nr:SDR family NAD(P)-dependent oxidoreductase [Chloroflexota bacterium]